MPQVARVLGQELPIRLSPSFLQKAACPLCLKWTYVDQIVTRHARVAAVRGAAAHLAIAVLTRLCLDQELHPRDLSDAQLRSAIAESTPHEVYSELGTIFGWLARWRATFDLRPKYLVNYEEKIAIDEHYQDAVWDEAFARGIIDKLYIIGRTAIVLDYKSQPNILSAAALDQHLQGSFYCWLISKFYPQIEEFIFRVWYLRYGFYADTRRTRRQIDLFEQQLLVQRQKVLEISDWDPVPGEHCGDCDYVHLCPVAADISPLPTEIVTPEQARRVASELRVKEEWTKRARAKLKVYAQTREEPIELPGYEYGFRASESADWDREQLGEVLRKNGIEIDEYLSADGKRLAKLLKRAERDGSALADDLRAARTVRMKTAFRGYRAAGGDDETTEEDGD